MADINARKRGKKWEYYFEIAKMDGKRKRISKGGFNTKAEAVSEGIKAMHEYQTAGSVNTPSELSMHDYLNYWIEMYCIPNLKPTTVANYKKYIRLHISPKIGKYRLASITAEQLQKLINDMVANGYSKNTVIGIKGGAVKQPELCRTAASLPENLAYGLCEDSKRFTNQLPFVTI